MTLGCRRDGERRQWCRRVWECWCCVDWGFGDERSSCKQQVAAAAVAEVGVLLCAVGRRSTDGSSTDVLLLYYRSEQSEERVQNSADSTDVCDVWMRGVQRKNHPSTPRAPARIDLASRSEMESQEDPSLCADLYLVLFVAVHPVPSPNTRGWALALRAQKHLHSNGLILRDPRMPSLISHPTYPLSVPPHPPPSAPPHRTTTATINA